MWRVLGFGGKANPLVYARVGCVAARCGQGSVDPTVCRSQLYVDDPSILAGGTPDECAREFDVIELSWLTQGFHSRLEQQGKPHCKSQQEEQFDTGFYEWIGIQYALRLNLAVMSPSAPFVEPACEARRPFTQRHGFESIKLARCAVEAARVAQVGGRLASRRVHSAQIGDEWNGRRSCATSRRLNFVSSGPVCSAMECSCYLRNMQGSIADGQTSCERCSIDHLACQSVHLGPRKMLL